MRENCAASCLAKKDRKPEHRRLSEEDRDRFHALKAADARGRVRELADFEGYVTVLVNAARLCGE